jgi:hypothetical protein
MTAILDYIGHGRALECFLGIYKLAFGIAIAMSDLHTRIPSFADFAWFYSSYTIAAPFFFLAFCHLVGLYLNIRGYEWSWLLRFIGAFSAMFVWTFLIIKSSWLGEPTLIIPTAIACLPASAFLIYKAWNGLPVAGRVGLV